jgi:hypothetical protein
MTGYAAIHANVYFPPELIPFRNGTVAGLARCAAIEMYFVAEIDESRNFVNADPRNGPIRFCIRSQSPDCGAISLHCLMTSHTRLGLGHAFYFADTHWFMAVIAFEARCRRMLFVTERNRLYGGARLSVRKDWDSTKHGQQPDLQITPVRICSAK